MADWTNIADTSIDPDAPLTSQLAFAWRDNHIAMGEGSVNSPYIWGVWHPYDSVAVGDGNDGEIYDFADDGAVSSVETPAFVSGFEYKILCEGLGSSGGTSGFRLEMYQDTSASFSAPLELATLGGSSAVNAVSHIEIRRPMVSSRVCSFSFFFLSNPGGTELTSNNNGVVSSATSQTFSKARVSFSGVNISSGKIYLHRRRVF